MTCANLILFFVCFVCVSELASGYLVKGRNIDSVFTKEVPVPKDMVDGNKLSLDQELPVPEITLNKKCVAIGQFCINHKDCCSNSCLGYMRRCVS